MGSIKLSWLAALLCLGVWLGMMRKMQLWLALIVLFGAVGFLPSQAEDNWGRLAAISATIGVNANRVCVGEASRGDIGCASNAPFVAPTTGGLTIVATSPTTNATNFALLLRTENEGQGGSVLMRIASIGYSGLWGAELESNSSYSPTGIRYGNYADFNLVNNTPHDSTPYGNINLVTNNNGVGAIGLTVGGGSQRGKVGISTTTPSTTLHVNGTLRIADGGEACESNRAGAIKYASAVFSFCNGSAWQTLAEAAGASSGDRITSGTTAVVANTTGYISLTTGGSTTGYMDTSGRLVVPGISVTTAQTSVTSLYASGNVGIGNANPTERLTIGSAADMAWNGISLLNNSAANAPLSIALTHVGLTSRFIATDSSNGNLYFGANAAAITNAAFSDAAQLTVTNAGNVGIGTTTPSKTLTVNGDADVSGTMKLAGTGSEVCGTGTFGQIRLNPATGKLELCRQ